MLGVDLQLNSCSGTHVGFGNEGFFSLDGESLVYTRKISEYFLNRGLVLNGTACGLGNIISKCPPSKDGPGWTKNFVARLVDGNQILTSHIGKAEPISLDNFMLWLYGKRIKDLTPSLYNIIPKRIINTRTLWDMTSDWQLQPEVEDKHCPFCDQEDENIDHLLDAMGDRCNQHIINI
ncbi:hypothetical protein ACJX0J_008742 [Zea mays]